MNRIQLIAVFFSFAFLYYISRLIIRNKLREEYSIVWICCGFVLMVCSFYERGLDVLSQWTGFTIPANLVFTGSIFAIFVYLLHLSVVASRLQRQNKQMAQKIALLEKKLNSIDNKNCKV